MARKKSRRAFRAPSKTLDQRGKWHYRIGDEVVDRDTYKDAVHDITHRRRRRKTGVAPIRLVSNLVATGLGLVATLGGGFGIDVLGNVLNDVISI